MVCDLHLIWITLSAGCKMEPREGSWEICLEGKVAVGCFRILVPSGSFTHVD